MDIKVDQNVAIVFDLDDTLYNELDFLRSAYISLAKEYRPDHWQALFSHMFALYRNNENAFEYLRETYGVSLEELVGRYREHVPNIHPFEGVITAFKSIKQKKGKIAILTDGRKTTQRNKIKVLGLLPLTDYIVVSEEIGSEKPSERNFKAVEREFDLSTYYYIGDNVKKDFVAPNTLGWHTIGLVDNGRNIHSNAHLYTASRYQPHDYITSFDQLNFI